jgi:hypothetical protein
LGLIAKADLELRSSLAEKKLVPERSVMRLAGKVEGGGTGGSDRPVTEVGIE